MHRKLQTKPQFVFASHDHRGADDLERRVRLACRQAFHEARLMERILRG